MSESVSVLPFDWASVVVLQPDFGFERWREQASWFVIWAVQVLYPDGWKSAVLLKRDAVPLEVPMDPEAMVASVRGLATAEAGVDKPNRVGGPVYDYVAGAQSHR
jgi:hypothetical protein